MRSDSLSQATRTPRHSLDILGSVRFSGLKLIYNSLIETGLYMYITLIKSVMARDRVITDFKLSYITGQVPLDDVSESRRAP